MPQIVSLLAALAFAGLLAVLHFIKPEIDPRWRMISEYEIGRHGALMRLAFACWTVSYLALAVVLWPRLPLAAAVLFVIVVLGPLGAGIYVADPIIAPPEAVTPSGRAHTAFGALFILGFPIVATIVAATGGATGLEGWLIAMAIIVWLGFLSFAVVSVRLRRAGKPPGPDAPIGVPNRLMAASYWLWGVVIAIVSFRLPG
jgi:Protein of unknown function (DUF998)